MLLQVNNVDFTFRSVCITKNMYLDISVIDDGTIGVEHLKKGIV